MERARSPGGGNGWASSLTHRLLSWGSKDDSFTSPSGPFCSCFSGHPVPYPQLQLNAILAGFHEVVPPEVLSFLQLGPKDLELLLTGSPVLDLDEWRRYTTVETDTPKKQQVGAQGRR